MNFRFRTRTQNLSNLATYGQLQKVTKKQQSNYKDDNLQFLLGLSGQLGTFTESKQQKMSTN